MIFLKKIHLINKKKKKQRFYLVYLLLLLLFLYYPLNKINNKINEYFYELSSIQVTKISKRIINEAINKTILDYINVDELFIIQRKSNGSIQMVDFNVKKLNEILLLINSNVIKYVKELEEGKSSILNINDRSIGGEYISDKNGIFLEIPMGIMFDNLFLINILPKIPIRITLNGDNISRVKTEVNNYGINNTILKAFVEIEINIQIILPRFSKNILIKNTVPIAVKMVQGEIPNYYWNNPSESIKNYWIFNMIYGII